MMAKIQISDAVRPIDEGGLPVGDEQAIKPIEEIKWLRWSNGKEWGEIHCPMLSKYVMTYWAGGPCYDTYTAPFVKNGEIYCYRYDQDEGGWDGSLHYLGEYENDETCRFG
jgi:hypothetical protein